MSTQYKNQISLVDITPNYNGCYTTSKKIAEYVNYSHKIVMNLIRKHIDSLEKFSNTKGELLKCTLEKSNGGLQKETMAILNKEQAMLLMSFMQNNKKIIEFKENLIRQFSLMERELISRNETRQIGKDIRNHYTNYISIFNDKSNFATYSFSLYTNLIYKKLFRKTAKEILIERKLAKKNKNVNLRDYLNLEELQKVKELEDKVADFLVRGKFKNTKDNEVYQKTKEYIENLIINK